MNINDYILKEIKALSLDTTISSAQDLCNTLTISHIPVVKNNILLGSFAEEDIQTIENKNSTLKDYAHLFHHFFTNRQATLLELIALFSENDCNIIPVIDKHQHYVGYYELSDMLDVFVDSPFMHHDNETLVVSKSKKDATMSQAAQIVESNNAKVLGLYVSNETTDTIEITLKIASEEINEIIQTFRRYDYTVITQHEDDFYLEELKDRANYLKRYLDM